MTTKARRGEVVLIVVLALSLVAGAFAGAKWFGKTAGSKKDTPIEKVEDIKAQQVAAIGKNEDKISAETKGQLSTAQAGVHATGEAIDRANVKAAAGNIPTRELATAKEINALTQAAIDAGLNQPVDPKLLKWFIDAIDKKNSDILREREYGEKMLASKTSELIASAEREAKFLAEKDQITASFSKKLAKAELERDEWALENALKAQRLDKIYFWIYAAAGIYVLALILPFAAKVFPALSGLSNVVGAVVGPGVAWAKAKTDRLAEDLVALQANSKKFVQEIDPTKVEAFKENAKTWWENDVASTAAVEEIKKKLRL